MTWKAVAVALVLIGCHKTPPEETGRPLCGADSATLCVLHATVEAGRPCTDGMGHKCVRCFPTNSALDFCFLDGVTSGHISGEVTAADWVVCVSSCNLCTPKEALLVDPNAICKPVVTEPDTPDMEPVWNGYKGANP